jgi:hypothetical protein
MKGFAFFVELNYENLPNFFTRCKSIGHYLEICKKANPIAEETIAKDKEEGHGRNLK